MATRIAEFKNFVHPTIGRALNELGMLQTYLTNRGYNTSSNIYPDHSYIELTIPFDYSHYPKLPTWACYFSKYVVTKYIYSDAFHKAMWVRYIDIKIKW